MIKLEGFTMTKQVDKNSKRNKSRTTGQRYDPSSVYARSECVRVGLVIGKAC